MSDAAVGQEHDFNARQAHILIILDKVFPVNLAPSYEVSEVTPEVRKRLSEMLLQRPLSWEHQQSKLVFFEM